MVGLVIVMSDTYRYALDLSFMPNIDLLLSSDIFDTATLSALVTNISPT